MLELNSLLVPTDFSAPSRDAFRFALQAASGDAPMILLLHVIDPSLVDYAIAHGWGEHDEIVSTVRRQAEEQLADYRTENGANVQIETIVCEGMPFLEIIRKAEEFHVDAVVMGKVGTRGKVEKLLFRTTAERVVRGSTRPVIILPIAED